MSGEALWILAAAGLAAIVLGLAIYVAALHARMRRLAGRIEDFLSCGGRPLSFSVREDALAPLHNAAAELQDRLLTAREHERGEGRRAGALTADISHQLKTPLATLRLYCELDGGAHLDGEIAQIERMEKLIYALLRLERLCASGYDFHFAAHDAAEIARRAWQPLGRLWPDRAFSIEGTARVRCDERWLGEALGKLSPREQRIRQMRFGLSGGREKTQREVADELGISQSYISRLEKRIIKRLRGEMSAKM